MPPYSVLPCTENLPIGPLLLCGRNGSLPPHALAQARYVGAARHDLDQLGGVAAVERDVLDHFLVERLAGLSGVDRNRPCWQSVWSLALTPQLVSSAVGAGGTAAEQYLGELVQYRLSESLAPLRAPDPAAKCQ